MVPRTAPQVPIHIEPILFYYKAEFRVCAEDAISAFSQRQNLWARKILSFKWHVVGPCQIADPGSRLKEHARVATINGALDDRKLAQNDATQRQLRN